jgi:carbamoyl-phosphate synthase large subunit
LRRAALLHKVPYYTTLAGAVAAAQGIRAYVSGDLKVRALQDYFPPTATNWILGDSVGNTLTFGRDWPTPA